MWRTRLRALCPTLSLTNTRTVRYAFSFLFALVAVAGLLSMTSSSKSSEVLLTTTTADVQTGETFLVDVYVSATTPINAVSILVTYPDNIEILGIDKGESVLTLWTREPTVEQTKRLVSLEGGTYKKGFIGKHKIATLRATAIGEGEGAFAVTEALLVAGDGRGTELSSDVTKAVIALAVSDKAAGESVVPTAAFAATTVAVSDLDNDGVVTWSDITLFMADWTTGKRAYDMNNDGKSTFRDFSILLTHFFSS